MRLLERSSMTAVVKGAAGHARAKIEVKSRMAYARARARTHTHKYPEREYSPEASTVEWGNRSVMCVYVCVRARARVAPQCLYIVSVLTFDNFFQEWIRRNDECSSTSVFTLPHVRSPKTNARLARTLLCLNCTFNYTLNYTLKRTT